MNKFQIVDSLDELDPESKNLIAHAQRSLEYAYAPYSKFNVAAAILLDNDEVVTGTNQENAAYPDGMCAERVALFAAVSRYPGVVIKRLAVVAKKENSATLTPATSCGSCRQVMLEFEQRQAKAMSIIMQNEEHKWVIATSAASLLPFCFTKSSLHLSDRK